MSGSNKIDSKPRKVAAFFSMGLILILIHHQMLLEMNVFSTAKSTADLRKRVLESDLRPSFPHTQFTPHIENDILRFIEEFSLSESPQRPYSPKAKCQTYRMVVERPYSAPSRIECSRPNHWCSLFQMVFGKASRILPYNVTVGITSSDFERWDSASYGVCIGT